MNARWTGVGLALVILTGLAAGCGSGGKSNAARSPSPSASQSLTATWAKWAACMRQHGVAVSDPILDKDNHPLYNYSAATGVSESVKAAARTACQSIVQGLPGGQVPVADPSTIAVRVSYSRCMRTHGIATFPDPDPATGVWKLNPQIDVHSAPFQQAQTACRPLLRGAN